MLTHSAHSLSYDSQETAAAVLSQAFENDPFMAYLFPDTEARSQKLTQLFLSLIRFSLRWEGVETSPDGSGVLLWLPSKSFAWPYKAISIIRSGLVGLPVSIGRSAFKRLHVHDSVCEQALKQNAPEDFAYLWVIGVRSNCAGRGVGKKMLHTALDAMRRRGHSACFLRTENPQNVGLYEHLGFKQVLTETPPGSGIQYWLMSQDL